MDNMVPVYLLTPDGVTLRGLTPEDADTAFAVEKACRQSGCALVFQDGTPVIPREWSV